ncbi:MAG: metallophosphoesterase [Hyphomicrobiales bacterium]|nr:metallophosphoesterase [Hyphomicrobiales bacterium]
MILLFFVARQHSLISLEHLRNAFKENFGHYPRIDLGPIRNNPDEMKAKARDIIKDYRKIVWDTDKPLTPAHTIQRHRESVAYLEKTLAEDFDGKTIVVTHHLPSEAGCFPDYRPPYDYSNPFFASHLGDLVIDSGADMWVFGHTHS